MPKGDCAMTVESSSRLAVLIDGDNVTSKIASELLAEIANYGTASVKRVYGDWTKPHLKGWNGCLSEHSIQPVQQSANTTGKNATDSAMIIEAMDLLYTGRFSGFCIVSSDGDFTRLAARIREQGVTVYGFGERKTPRSFVNACERFVYFDVLCAPGDKAPATQDEAKAKTTKKADDKALHIMLKKAMPAVTDEDGWANLSEVGSRLQKQAPDFDARNYGYSRLSELVKATGFVDVERTGPGQKIVIVRLRPLQVATA
jgi:NYN domain/OST-HTH/LOTUS domain